MMSQNGRDADRSIGSGDAGWRSSPILRLASILAIGLGIVLIARWMPVGRALGIGVDRIRGLGPWGPVVFGLIDAAAVVLMVPGAVLTMAAGALFGPVVGTVTASLASSLGAALAFVIARSLGRAAVARRVRRDPRFEAIDRAIAANGWKIVALLRLSPAVPFNVQNYLYGLTGIGFWTCVLTSGVAMLPGTFLYVYLGHVGRTGWEAASGRAARPRTPAEWVLMVIGLLATVAVMVYLAGLARRELRRQASASVLD
jgi:uncharacterized membrane protein YdjX (TVP38/TMEM64 family)